MGRDERRQAVNKAELEGRVADSHDVRLELMRRVKSGEITLEQAQADFNSALSEAQRKRAWLLGIKPITDIDCANKERA